MSFLFAPLLLGATGASRADAAVLISIDKSAQQMVVSIDGVRKYTWPVSTGAPGYSTPSGRYTPFRMEKDHFSKEWDDAPMPNSIFFTMRGHAIHGTLDGRRLGSAVSHGCVRLSTAHALTLFTLVKDEGMANTKVVVEGNESAAPLVARRRRAAPEPEYAARAPQYGQPADEDMDTGPQPQLRYPRAVTRTVQPQYETRYRTDAYGTPIERDAYGRVVMHPQAAQTPLRERYQNGYIVRGDGSVSYPAPAYGEPAPRTIRRPYGYD